MGDVLYTRKLNAPHWATAGVKLKFKSNLKWSLLASFALAGMALFGCGSQSGDGGGTTGGGGASNEPIKIGMIASLNGENQPWGVDSKKGAELAVEEFNAAGGVDGRMVELIVEDTQSKPEGGKSATEKLVGQDKVWAVVGEVASGITLQAADVCEEAGVPLVAVGATRVDITENRPHTFRACFTDNFQGAALAKYAYDDLGLRNVAMMTDRKLPYSTGLSDMFRKVFTSLGGKIVAEEFYEAGNIDFKAQLTNIKSKNPDGLFCSGYFTEVGPIARQREQVGLKVPMLGGDGWDSTKLIDSGGSGIIGGYFLNHYHNSEPREEVKNFVEKFKKKFGDEPATAMGALGYDGTMVVLQALKESKAKNPEELTAAIANIKDLKGVSGTITIGPDHNAQKPGLILKVEKTGFVPVKQVPFFEFKE